MIKSLVRGLTCNSAQIRSEIDPPAPVSSIWNRFSSFLPSTRNRAEVFPLNQKEILPFSPVKEGLKISMPDYEALYLEKVEALKRPLERIEFYEQGREVILAGLDLIEYISEEMSVVLENLEGLSAEIIPYCQSQAKEGKLTALKIHSLSCQIYQDELSFFERLPKQSEEMLNAQWSLFLVVAEVRLKASRAKILSDKILLDVELFIENNVELSNLYNERMENFFKKKEWIDALLIRSDFLELSWKDLSITEKKGTYREIRRDVCKLLQSV